MDIDENEVTEEVLLLAALLEDEENERAGTRLWTHKINQSRETEGEFHTLYLKLRMDETRFFMYFRMTIECFDELLELIQEDVRKQHTHFREPIEPVERLSIALRFLATGDSYATIGHSFRVGFSTVSKIVEEVCEAIWNRLQPTCLEEPTTQTWEQSIAGYEEKWQFPNCLGSIDGKHVTIKCPKKTGSNYFCYLKKFSIVLMAIVDHEYKFTCIDVGGYGKNSDGGIFEASNMGQKFHNGTLNVPVDRPLPGQDESTPCVLIGDEAFPLTSFLMRPFPYRQPRLDQRKENYNKRLCRARRVVENAFGILVQKWRVFLKPFEIKVETTIKVVKACCVLHNFLRMKKCDDNFTQEAEENLQGNFENLDNDGRRAPNYAFTLRERFVNYFNM